MTRADKYRRQICEIGRIIHSAGYIAANDGNISVRLETGLILITPANVSKGGLKPGQIAEIDLSGSRLDSKTPSSEYHMHLEIYKRCPDVNAIIHTHPPFATAWAVSGKGLNDPVLPEIITTIGKIPLIEYRPPSTRELAELVGEAAGNYDVMLLQNHGLVSTGIDLKAAYYNTERAEHAFKILTIAQSFGKPKPLSATEIKELLEICHVPDRIRKTF